VDITIHVRVVPGSNLGQEVEVFHRFSQSLGIGHLIRPREVPLASFAIHYPLLILPLDTIYQTWQNYGSRAASDSQKKLLQIPLVSTNLLHVKPVPRHLCHPNPSLFAAPQLLKIVICDSVVL
jgi:hypothetical protein